MTILIGVDKTLYLVHKALLVHYCPFFAACLKPTFVEGVKLEVHLETVVPHAFDGFVSWLYNGNIMNMDLETAECCNNSIMMYQYADEHLIPMFKNVILDGLRHALRKLHTTPLPSHLQKLDELNLLNSQLGRFCLRSVVWSIRTKQSTWITKHSEDEDDMIRYEELQDLYKEPEFAVKVMKAMIEYGDDKLGNPAFSDDCDYHEHSDGERCPPSNIGNQGSTRGVPHRRKRPEFGDMA